MKKVFLMLAAVLVSMSAMAQVQFGAKVGFDMTNFWGENVDHGMAPNYQIGALMEYKFNDKFAISPEVVFAAQGGKGELKEGAYKYKQTYNANYINVPVMLKYYVSPSFAIDLGPQVGFNVYSKLTSKLEGQSDGVSAKVEETEDMKDITKTVDFGVGLGATYSLTENAFVQARYTLGLTKAFKIGDAKNSNIQIAFGWKF